MTEEHDSTHESLEGGQAEQAEGSFEQLGLKPSVMAAIKEMGFETPTEVEWKAIPLALAGRDLLVQSRTGTGKTAAFGIPFAQSLVDPGQKEVQALVLAPTRELALQVAEECGRLTRGSELRVTAIYGGAAMGPQVTALREGSHVVVGTPGRVLDHMRRGTLKTSSIRTLVLDECDEMLSMGFHEEISAIIDQLPAQRQTLLFSATIPDEIQRMAERYLHEAVELKLSEDFVGVREINHIYYLISGSDRSGDLLRVLEYENPDLALIFCNTRDDTAQVADFLKARGFKAEGISSDLTQAEREQVMKQMRAGELRFLVATDIAARGIDITDISHVINYTFPESADVYVHRTGRTGRAGKSGIAVSLVSPREIGSFYYLKLIHKIFPEERHLPSPEELATRREGERYQRLQQLFADRQVSEEMRGLARRVMASLDGERLLALALAVALEEARETFARPAPAPVSRREYPERVRERERERGERPERGRPRAGRERKEREHRREGGGPPRARTSRGRSRDQEEDRGRRRRPRDRGEALPERRAHEEPGPAPVRERKTTRTRRRPEPELEPEVEGGYSGTFLTPDGDVEHWEILEPGKSADEPKRAVPAENEARLYINVGRRQGARSDELGDFVRREASLISEELIDLRIRDSHSYFSVPPEMADAVIARLSGKSFKDRMLKVERARK